MMTTAIVSAMAGGLGLAAMAAAAQAAACLTVSVTGLQGTPPAYNGHAGPGTLVRYGDDAGNCDAVRLQFDAERGTNLRLSQVGVQSAM
ncbi:MAG: hypothetical protein HY056_10270, partial [Proteobacteria bacterium]|nr:hypothetical protein [Pseudomonadota bacterium]